MVSEASPRVGLSEYETIPISEASHETTVKQSVQREDGSEALLHQGRYTSELEETNEGIDSIQVQGRPPRRKCSIVACYKEEPLLTLTIIGVLAGIAIGLLLKPAELSTQAVDLLGFPGEIMLRLLKMLVLPLVAGSMIAGVCSLRGSGGGSMARVARWTLAFYGGTTLAAVLLGVILVNVIRPGAGAPFNSVASCAGAQKEAADAVEHTSAPLQAFLDVVRSAFPDNIVAAAVNMNILGVISFSLFFGIMLSSLGETADGMIHSVNVFNAAIGKMVTAVLWVSPLGIASLIAASICRTCNLASTLAALGWWVLAVLLGLTLQAVAILPGTLWVTTRQNPLKAGKAFSQALVLAFGTGSSTAALPVTMECATAVGCGDSIVKFVLPLGATVNMNGTALYEALTVIFIAQAHGVSLGAAETAVVACTATLAAVGAAAIPSAGLVTMLMVMQAVGLDRYASDLAVILAIDWFLDRCRTAVNVLGDAFAVVTVDHLAKSKLAQQGMLLAGLELGTVNEV